MFGFKNKKQSYKKYWCQTYERDKKGFDQALRKEVFWLNWDRNMMPESAAEQRFLDAIIILSGSENWELARAYLTRSQEIIERIQNENKLQSDRCIASFPMNRGTLRRTTVYVESMLGSPWDNELLVQASKDFEEYIRENYTIKNDWDSQIQYYYLNAIHTALLGNDLVRAQKLLAKPPFPLSSHRQHVDLLQGLIQYATGEMDDYNQEEFISAYRTFVDKVRDLRIVKPKDYFMQIELGPLELIMLYETIISHPTENINWTYVIDIFSSDF